MNRRFSRRKFVVSAAVSITPSAIAYAYPKGVRVLSSLGKERDEFLVLRFGQVRPHRLQRASFAFRVALPIVALLGSG